MASIYKNDDTSAFGKTLLTININNPEGYTISKAKLKIGNLPVMTFKDPEFPLKVNLTAAQTRQLQTQNECFLAVYDINGKKATCKGSIKFVAKDEVVE